MTEAISYRIGVIALAGVLCCGTLQAQGPAGSVADPPMSFKAARITFLPATARITAALRESITREVQRQVHANSEIPAPVPRKKMKTGGKIAIIAGVVVGVAYLLVVATARD